MIAPAQEATELSAHLARVEAVFAEGDLPRIAQLLASIRAGLALVGDVPEFAGAPQRLQVRAMPMPNMVHMHMNAVPLGPRGWRRHKCMRTSLLHELLLYQLKGCRYPLIAGPSISCMRAQFADGSPPACTLVMSLVLIHAAEGGLCVLDGFACMQK